MYNNHSSFEQCNAPSTNSLHDFIFTQNWYVFYQAPLQVLPDKLLGYLAGLNGQVRGNMIIRGPFVFSAVRKDIRRWLPRGAQRTGE
jgi:carotenoid cleavage dioxygenase-like enzyme